MGPEVEMNIFQVVKSVLDEQYAAIPGTEAQRDDVIAWKRLPFPAILASPSAACRGSP